MRKNRIKPLAERFFKYVEKTQTCWFWKAGRFSNGYGMFTVDRIPRKAHRVSWTIHNGPIPEGLLVLHICDIKHCVNPSHLWLGTQKQNIEDRDKKGRQAWGNTGGTAKLTSADVKEIRNLYSSRQITQNEMAKRFNVHLHTIENAIHGRSWYHLK